MAKPSDQQPLSVLHSTLFTWWHSAGRVLPWREKVLDAPSKSSAKTPEQPTLPTLRERAFASYMAGELGRDPYRVVVAEIMLQQTQVDRVLPKYLAWIKQWPAITDLANAQLSQVLIFWQGLGYNRRSRFLWLLAKEIVEQHGGIWPQTEAELVQLPGIGRYTARAVLSFAFGQQVGVVDTNVKRVLRRLLDGKEVDEEPKRTEKEWFIWADQVIPARQADPWNQLIMDFGALVCTAKAPRCSACPARNLCQAQQKAHTQGFVEYRDYLQAHQPVKKKKNTIRFEDTDRYFRGRVMDLLREQSLQRDTLWEKMSSLHGLESQERFENILRGLMGDQLVEEVAGVIRLP